MKLVSLSSSEEINKNDFFERFSLIKDLKRTCEKKRFNIIDKWSKKSNEYGLIEWAGDIRILLPVVFVVDGLVWDFQLIDFFSLLNH